MTYKPNETANYTTGPMDHEPTSQHAELLVNNELTTKLVQRAHTSVLATSLALVLNGDTAVAQTTPNMLPVDKPAAFAGIAASSMLHSIIPF